MHLDFSTFCLMSVPGFLVGVMAGKFVAGNRGNFLRQRLGFTWKIIGGIAQAGYFLLTLITLGIMLIYLVNSNDTQRTASFWITILAGLWMIYNLISELIGILPWRTREGVKKLPNRW